MKITKRIQGYVYEEVSNRVMPRYEADKLEAERRRAARDKFLENCATAAAEAYEKYYSEHFEEVAEFAEATEHRPTFYNSRSISLIDSNNINSVFCWESRRSCEVRKLAESILIELELGGTKEKLEELLSSI